MKKAACILLAVILIGAAGFGILVSTDPDFAAELGLASGPGKPVGGSLNDIIANAPRVAGTVREVHEASILIESENGEYWVSLTVENADSMTHLSVGDEVIVYYDGTVAETWPMQIHTVYAITLETPADRAENEKP